MEKEQPQTYGPYRVVRKLGSGGMGTVYEARHEVLGRSVAIKTIGAELSLTEDTRARFLREARAAAKVSHRNVAQVHDVSVEGDVPYMVLELLQGQTLAALLQTQVVLNAEKAADLLVPIIAGVCAAHACGIVHRDLKPQNLFISEEQSNLVPRVLDFGISKLVDQEVPIHTRSDVILGTAHYMSPEQARGNKRLDARSDQYSLGAVLYESVTGRKPFDDDSLLVLINRIGVGEFKRPREVYSGVSPELEAVILKAMSLLPNDRYATAALFGQALLPFASYKTRLNYAQEFARSSDVAATAPFDAADYALRPHEAPRPDETRPNDTVAARDSAPSRAQPQSNAIPALSSPVEHPAPHAVRKHKFANPRQLTAAIALLCVGGGVGYSLKFAPGVGNAAAPTQDGGTSSAGAQGSVPGSAVAQSLEFGTSTGNFAATPTNSAPEPLATPVDIATSVHAASTADPISSDHRLSEVAALPSFGQKVRVAPATSNPTGASSNPLQNRAQQHGLVQDNPF